MRKKLQRFAENELRRNVVQPGKPLFGHLQGRWGKEYFKNSNPIVLEVGCGRGEYTIGLARRYPKKNFIGIDIKGDRIWRGSKEADESGLANVAFLRIHAAELANHFARQEVESIWITFPDPRPKKSDTHRRLTYPRYLELYREILVSNGEVHLKTDHANFFQYTLEEVKNGKDIKLIYQTTNLYQAGLPTDLEIKTKYETPYLEKGLPICYMRFKFL